MARNQTLGAALENLDSQYEPSVACNISATFLISGAIETVGRIIRVSETGAVAEGITGAATDSPVVIFLKDGTRIVGNATQIAADIAAITVSPSKIQRAKLSALTARATIAERPKKLRSWQQRAERVSAETGTTECLTAAGDRISCRVVDISLSGIGIATEGYLSLGDVVRLGKSVGQVVRRTDRGFGLKLLDKNTPLKSAPYHAGRQRSLAENAPSYRF